MLIRAAAVLLAAAASAPLHAQSAARAPASPFLPSDHWTMDVAKKLDGLGLAPSGFDPGVRSLRIHDVAIVLEHALRSARADGAVSRLVEAYHARFVEEFGAFSERRTGGFAGSGSLGAGYERRRGWVLGGIGYSDADWTGPLAAPDIGSARADATLAVGARQVALGVRTFARDDEIGLRDGHGVLEIGRLGAWAGRRAPGYGAASGGAIVLSGDVVMDGVGLYLTESARLPWVFRHLGLVGVDMFVTRVHNGDVIRDPWLWGSRVHVAPHARLGIGMSRGSMFGGEGGAPITGRNLLYMLVGEHAGEQGEFANQVFALDLRYRAPVGLPLVVYIEWGMDDTSGGYWRSPGVIAGLELAGVPGATNLALRLERASFAAASFKNTIWYRNWAMRGGWTHENRVLGHPLAGHGTEWLAGADVYLLDARLRVQGAMRWRDRALENLYAPDRAGPSTAGSARVAWRVTPRLEFSTDAEIERGGDAWRASALLTAARLMF